MPEIETFETCPVCGGNGLKWRRAKQIARRDTPPADRCVACQGDGVLRQRRLRDLVLRGVRASAATKQRTVGA
jgi:DnaJ-class molecular chaperone